MASRLMQRCICLLATQQASSLTVIGRLRLGSIPSKMMTTTRGSAFSTLDKLLNKEPVFTPYPPSQEVDQKIEEATTPEEVLELLDSRYKLHHNHAALMVIKLSRLLVDKHLDKNLLDNDVRLKKLFRTMDSQVSSVWHGTLMNLLRSLYALQLPENFKPLLSVEQEVRWRLRRVKYKNLVFLAETSIPYMQDRASRELLTELLMYLERRWTEIEDCRTVVVLMAKVGHLSGALMDRLEDKFLELAEQFGPEDLRKVMLILASQNRRSVPLLRAISYHLAQKPFALTRGMLIDFAYAYGKLNFHQTQIFQKLASELLPQVSSMTPSDVTQCSKSFAFLKWLNLPLFEAFAQYVINKADDFTPLQLSNMILTFARLNFHPEQEEQFFSLVHRKLESELDKLSPGLQVDVVWSLCILQQVQKKQLQEVLCQDFHSQFLDGKFSQNQNTCQKLIHINATAQLEHPEYTGPFLPPVALHPQASTPKTPMQKDLQEILKGWLGSDDKVRFGEITQYGWELDAELVLDVDNQPLPMKDFLAPHLAQPTGTRPLPPGAKRLVFLRWEFPNFNSRSKDLLGRFVMAKRHLRAAGFLLVDVPYYEWIELKSEWQKGAYLKDKMGKALAEDLAK
ncbi:FAST kinase domain-containing protein 4 [Antechinus flavipes]|uniref:FAST kinase domain-containing protein 4 n=1 Tax=Antechinus flavipes TaxID=38775 RepID=UPI002235666E|nr:FAST kinase domain-containing protein 4 [Antechinus flavipes]XP_051840672.1 FAST kinase domain-containing protein 4 [Antechinus flavipes]XP_051840681.1 FAST kinase domain-containing protein 4 [Antechinus flavipes]XP_051840690.1 FAST kinase domain-containing protein 4 [Antechinus flavipes]